MTYLPRISATDLGNPGGETVGNLKAISGDRVLAILMYRDWFAGEDGRARISDVFRDTLAADAAHWALLSWTDLMSDITRHARRPLAFHAPHCDCIGADEAVFAQLITLAARGAREDAMLMLSLMIQADRLIVALNAAEDAGRAILASAIRLGRSASRTGATLH